MPAQESVLRQSLRLLIVDDSPDDRAEIRRLVLRGADRPVAFTEVECGSAAVSAIRSADTGPPDCVLLDYTLPDMNAVEVLTAVIAADGLPPCPVVVVTGIAGSDMGRAVIRAGAQDYIGKEWLTPHGLIRAVENAAERWAMAHELHKKEAALCESEAHFRLIFASAAVGIARLGLDGRFVEVNDAFARIHGFDRDEVPGMTVQQLTHPDDRPADLALMRRLLDGELPTYTLEKRKFRKDGSVIWVNHAVSLDRLPGGMARHFISAVHDITDRKQAERKLFESNSRLEALMRALPVGVSFSEDATCERITGNPAVLAQFAVPPTENLSASAPDPVAFGRKLRFLHAGQPLSDTELPLQRAVAENRIIPPLELEVVMPDGRHWFAEASGAPIHDERGAVVAGVAVTLDITDRKRAEHEIRALNADLEARVARRTAQLEEANRELESFSYSVSHDMRAPLRSIQGFSQILLEEYATHLPPEAKDCLNEVCGNTKQMGRLIDDLLAFSRLGRAALEKSVVSADRLARQCIADLGRDRSAEFRVADLPSCSADPALLKQVWLNLLSNALKYSRGRKQPVVEVGARAGERELVYFVKDNGVGFDMRYAHNLFGVFQRLHRQEDYEGTGVGLAIVQRVVHRHGGRVWAEAQPDQGATFYFSLPLEGATA
ncbi:hybrid sensor histidine kinase/response regulator [Frigoriglobus tundricola]|uniref:histidine kinase n=1 Tax=Frigoriglobus tundricola TaxID=2774151 RepID=A0A6M5YHD7_9BACT|nr:hybrid sensor histidine kinase/response regulator [Frigoriglobus tundricola]QJW92964.1 hypothetical protein FTUN_0462 [Frigoriglobus tundricola]